MAFWNKKKKKEKIENESVNEAVSEIVEESDVVENNSDDIEMKDKLDDLEEIVVEEESIEEKVMEEVSEVIGELKDEASDVAEVIEDVNNKVEEIELEIEVPEKVEEVKKGFFAKLKMGLEKTRKGMSSLVDDLFTSYGEIDEELYEELEEILIMADVGMDTTLKIIDNLKAEIKVRKIKESNEVKVVFKEVLVKMLDETNNQGFSIEHSPTIIMVIGVNGAGKTTSIGKIANNLKTDGKSVLIAAGDTFRAAAIDQLKVWADRANVPVVHGIEGGDPASVVFDAVHSAKSRNTDVLIIDTAGRLHNKVNLMKELEKMNKIIDREFPNAKRETLLVLDATTGQNAVQQAQLFNESAAISGIVLTKLDGTAKGGVVLAINSVLDIPVKLIGVGEGIDDLQNFDSKQFVDALFG